MKVSYKLFRNLNWLNRILNFVICLSVIFVTKGNLLYVICSYCITDAVLMLCDKLLERHIINSRAKETDHREEILNEFYGSSDVDRKYVHSLVDKILEKQREYQQLQEQIKQEQEQLELQTKLTSVRGLERIIGTIDEFLKFYEDFKKENELKEKKTLKKISETLSSIKTILIETKPEASQIISGTFHIYINDFMQILKESNNIPDLAERDKRIKEVIDEMLKYVTLLENDINHFQREDITVSINVLLQELKKENANN